MSLGGTRQPVETAPRPGASLPAVGENAKVMAELRARAPTAGLGGNEPPGL